MTVLRASVPRWSQQVGEVDDRNSAPTQRAIFKKMPRRHASDKDR